MSPFAELIENKNPNPCLALGDRGGGFEPSFQKIMGKHPNSVDNNVLRRIVGKGKGWVFTPSDFQDLGSRTAVDLASCGTGARL